MIPIIDTNTSLYAVIGNPVAHSLSPAIHNAAFQAAGLDCVYLAFRVDDVEGALGGMRSLPNFRGLSVTIPHKRVVMDYLDEIDEMATSVGSVNTVVNEEGRLKGYTTDGPGALRAFKEAGVSLEGKKVLFLGSGGAVRAVSFAVARHAMPASVTILGRTPHNVKSLVDDLNSGAPVPAKAGSLENDLEAAMTEHDVVIQGTPTGMAPERTEQTLIAKEQLRREQVVFDMVYRPQKTRLVFAAQEVGCTTLLGHEMLLYQAVLQFELWTGVDAPEEEMRQALERGLAEG